MGKRLLIGVISFLFCFQASAQVRPGAVMSWTTIEAEDMHTNGILLQQSTDPHLVETESSGRMAVRLETKAHSIETIAPVFSNTLVIRYSLPDNAIGKGLSSSLDILVNGKTVKNCGISSYNNWLYGHYPFSNVPDTGKPRHFYDEVRIKDINISKGDIVQIRRGNDQDDKAAYCIIDLIDFEEAPPVLEAPENIIWVTDPVFKKYLQQDDYTLVFRKCIEQAATTKQTIWIPPGEYKISGDLIFPSNIKMQGAGIWHTILKGDKNLYAQASRRVRLKGKGSNIHLSDFSIDGALNYRSDKEDNDGIVGSFGENSSISNIWIEHTKVGIWVENSTALKVSGCRFRNTIADGINFCVGMANSIMENCTTRGTGDDGFAIWPASFGKQQYKPGNNLIIHCTAQLPFLANGAAVYGGESNSIRHCLFTDITQGAGILISTTFPTENQSRGINNNFSGTTMLDSCVIESSGGFDHEWDWRGAIEICTDKRTIAGLVIKNIVIKESLSNAIRIISKNTNDKKGILKEAELINISTEGKKEKNGLLVVPGASGSLRLIKAGLPVSVPEEGNFSILH
jgi:hypothetical protein